MGKTRTKNRHLPRRMYLIHGAYFYVDKANKFHKLSRDYAEALRVYASKIEKPVGDRIDVLIGRYENEILPQKSKVTQRGRKQEFKRIRKVFGHMPVADVRQAHAFEYYETAGRTQMARHELRALSVILTYAANLGLVAANPLLGQRLAGHKARTRYVTDAEFMAVRSIAPLMIRCAMDVALITALRQRDILTLERRQIVDKVLTVTASKTGKAITFPVAGDLEAAIKEALAEPPQARRPVIANRAGKAYSRDGFQSIWQRVQIKALKDGAIAERFTFHDIRAKSLSDAGTLEEARQRAQHSDARITDKVYRRLPEMATVATLPAKGTA